MFRHQGKSRTLKHNLQIASLLSFVAGIVNITGFLALGRLTTNVTGHFAHFINDVTIFDLWEGIAYLFYILAFLCGSFTSSLLIELMQKLQKLNIYVLPTLLESTILLFVPLAMLLNWPISSNTTACLLLFAMGVQNSFVTKISNAVVRTTHLTGLFTDLGIELSQLIVTKNLPFKAKIVSTIKLRLIIIAFFFIGGISGGLLHGKMGYNNLLIAVTILLCGLIYDNLRYHMILAKRKFSKREAANLST